MKLINPLKKDERGIASIIIVIIMMTVLTLITLAMARNANREQRQALDRQLSSQAFYAAEAGINDTTEYIRKNLADPNLPSKKTACNDNPTQAQISGNATSPGQVGNDAVIKYTCVLYDRQPSTIELSNVASDSSTIVPIQNGNGTGIGSLTISWDNPDASGGSDFAGCPATNTLPQTASYSNCDVGMLRLELFNSSTGSLNRSSLIDSDFTAFIYPGITETPVNKTNNTGTRSGVFAAGSCSATGTPRKCTVHINDMGVNGDGQLYLRVRTLYKAKSSLVISGTDISAAGAPVSFKGAQMMIDVTGKANDVLKRLQVRKQIIPSYNQSDYGIKTTESLCKQIDVYPTFSGQSDTCTY